MAWGEVLYILQSHPQIDFLLMGNNIPQSQCDTYHGITSSCKYILWVVLWLQSKVWGSGEDHLPAV